MKSTILQITDTHVFGGSGEKLYNINTNQRFDEIIKFIKKNNIIFDYIFLTGDISQDKSEASYKMISEELSSFNKDIYWIPGNHDDKKKSGLILPKNKFFKKEDLYLDDIGWNFLFLDTTIDGEDGGYLFDDNIASMKKKIESMENNASIAIVMHHHLLKVNTPLVDKYIIENKELFFEALSTIKKKISLIICGHVHGDYDISENGIRMISSPATCLQWKKGTSDPFVEDRGGFTLWEFRQKGVFSYETFFV